MSLWIATCIIAVRLWTVAFYELWACGSLIQANLVSAETQAVEGQAALWKT